MAKSIVTYAHRYKRPPRKRPAQAATIIGPAVVRARKPKSAPRPEPSEQEAAVVGPAAVQVKGNPLDANNDRPSPIVTARSPRSSARFGTAPDLTPDELRQRGDAADALFRKVTGRTE